MRRWLWVAIAVLYIVSVPWYRESGAEPRIVWGLPDWVAVALGCYVAIAVLNALAWGATEISDAGDSESAGSTLPDPASPPPSARVPEDL